MTDVLLRIQDLSAYYGSVQALFDVSIDVQRGQVFAVLGANGAGKTTLFRSISRMVTTRGVIQFNGESITRASTDAVARLGIAHVPEGRGTIFHLTVEENLRLAILGAKARRKPTGDMDHVMSYFPVLRERRGQIAGTMSGGEQQMLALARGLLSSPDLMLLDEPTLGLAPKMIEEVFRILTRIKAELKISLILSEQNSEFALGISDRVVLLEAGRVKLSGGVEECKSNDLIRRSYLGY